MEKIDHLCGCMSQPHPLRRAILDIAEEVREFLEEPSAEEASDVMFAVGRFLAGRIGRIYVRVPGDRICVEKLIRRARESGCVRSLRHRPPGVCAAELE